MKATKGQIKEAFRKTIIRWERITEDVDYFEESSCSLCRLENTPEEEEMYCNASCPIKSYKDEDHFACRNTPYKNFWNERDYESALVELNFLREVYLDFLENEIQEKLDELNKAIKEEIREAEKKEEWVNITKEIEWRLHQAPCTCGYWVRGYYEGEPIVWLDNDGIDSFSSRDAKVEKSDMSFNVLKRIEK